MKQDKTKFSFKDAPDASMPQNIPVIIEKIDLKNKSFYYIEIN